MAKKATKKETKKADHPMKKLNPIDAMDQIVNSADPEWLRMNGEFAQVLVAYKVQRPAIIERRDRMAARAAAGAKQSEVASS